MNTEWKPIASAPKDGTRIAIKFANGNEHQANWRTTYGGEWHVDSFKYLPWADQHEITHWMPLPAAPGSPASTVATEGEKDEQAAFEHWLDRTCPSGDVEAVQRQWEASSDYADLHAPAAGDALAWQGLTKDEQDSFVGELIGYGTDFVAPLYSVVEGIEQRLREKNAAIAQQSQRKEA